MEICPKGISGAFEYTQQVIALGREWIYKGRFKTNGNITILAKFSFHLDDKKQTFKI